MSQVPLVETTALSLSRPLLEEIDGAFGTTPAMFRAVANSPAALKMMWASFGALGGGRLEAKLGEQIAVLVADRNGCSYCLAAHTTLGGNAGATAEQMSEAQVGRSADARTTAVLAFAQNLVDNRAHLSDGEVEKLRAEGLDDEEIVEVVAHVALNLFTNYINVALDVPVDFPVIPLRNPRR